MSNARDETAGARGPAGRFVAPPGQEALVRAMLAVDPRVGPWELASIAVEATRIVARYRAAHGGEVVIQLVHADEDPGRPHVRTARFRVGASSDAPDAVELLRRVAARVARLEARWVWVREAPRREARARGSGSDARDAELVGLLARVRRGVRATVTGDEATAARARYEREGLAVRAGGDPIDVDGVPHVVLYVGRDEASARELERAERAGDDAALGALLGYPACCVAAFVARKTRPLRGVHDAFLGARAAWVARPSPRLNNLLFGEGVRLVSFEPCRYDCPRAVAVADRVFDALAALDAEAAATVDASLARAVAIAEPGARAVVALDAGPPRRIARAVAVRQIPARPVSDADRAFAARLAGAAVGDGGLVRVDASLPPTLVLDFGG